MADFGKAVEVILEHEGGSRYSDHPADRGGPTRWGITAGTLGEWRKLGRAATADEVKALDRAEACAIYRARYWNACRCEEIEDQLVAVKVFDIAVNCGIVTAGRLLQRAVNRCQSGVIAEDGRIGPRTLEAVAACDPGELVVELVHCQTEYYLRLCEANPSQGVFKRTWLRRARFPFDMEVVT
jgi:lysozyme family protein